jgi:hypothetical protein
MIRMGLVWLALCMTAPSADIESLKSEPNLEKRSEKALLNANAAITAAREAYSAGDSRKARMALEETASSVELSYDALSGTGKHPRQSPKHFKHAELSVREMLRRLKDLENDVGVDDRPVLVETEDRLQRVHDELLDGIMSKKK